MKNKYPLLSIVIATFNSEQILKKVLDSIYKQTYPLEKIEIIIVDGGSTDTTKKIALSYHCKFLKNDKTFPVWGKLIGYKHAKGDYLMYLDSDEVIEKEDSIERKIGLFSKHTLVHAVTGSGYKNPEDYPFFNQYINEFGDPFSFFFYNLSKDARFFIDTLKKRYKNYKENSDHIIIDFSGEEKLPIFELIAMGSVIDLNFCKRKFPEIMQNPGLVAHLFYLLIKQKSQIGILKEDSLIHYSSKSFRKYLKKINSRIIDNIYTSGKGGFQGRNKFFARWEQYRKYLFLPYSFSIFFPLVDSVHLAFTRKNLSYLSHCFLCFYTASLIIYFSCLKLIHIKPIHKKYG